MNWYLADKDFQRNSVKSRSAHEHNFGVKLYYFDILCSDIYGKTYVPARFIEKAFLFVASENVEKRITGMM